LADPGVNLHICLDGGLQVASIQIFDFIDLGKSEPAPEGGSEHAKRVKKPGPAPERWARK